MKVWGRAVPRPDGDLRRFYELAMDGIAESDVAIEVSTAGLRKPVGEIYPAGRSSRCAWRRGGRWRCRATPTCPSNSATSTSRAVELAADRSASTELARSSSGRERRDGGARMTRALRASASTRTGFEEGRRLVLGGVEIPVDRGLAGHSDADVLTHAVIDALLGAAGLGDIGAALPRHRRALARCRQPRAAAPGCASCDERGLVPGNVDAVVVCEAPRLGAHRDVDARAAGGGARGARGGREREVHHGRGDGLRRAWRGHRRGHGGAHARRPIGLESLAAMDRDDLAFAGAAGLAGEVREGQVSSAKLVELFLDRIGRLDPGASTRSAS